MPPVELWARAMLATCIWEGLVHQDMAVPPLVRAEALLMTLLVNTLTHPALWYVAPRFEPWWLWLIVMESAVVAVEAVLIGVWLRERGGGQSGLRISLIANTLSTVVGLLGWY